MPEVQSTKKLCRTRSQYSERQYGRTHVRRTERFQISRCTVRLTLRYSSEIQNEYEVKAAKILQLSISIVVYLLLKYVTYVTNFIKVVGFLYFI